VKLSHAGYDGLSGLLIHGDVKRRILFGQSRKPLGEPLLIGLCGRLHGQRDDRLRKGQAFEQYRGRRITKRIARPRLFKAGQSHYHACGHRAQILALIRLHSEDASHPLSPSSSGIEHSYAVFYATRINASEDQAPHIWIDHDLESQGSKWFVYVGFTKDGLPRIRVNALHGRKVQRRGEVIHHSIQKELDPFVLEGRSAQNRHYLHARRSLLNNALEEILGYLLATQIKLHKLVIKFCRCLQHGIPRRFRLSRHGSRYI
jgi:hypothetical protein